MKTKQKINVIQEKKLNINCVFNDHYFIRMILDSCIITRQFFIQFSSKKNPLALSLITIS